VAREMAACSISSPPERLLSKRLLHGRELVVVLIAVSIVD
jgi:hypothetical protein